MARSFEVRDGDAGARKFPGPITLFPSREREAVKRMGMSTILGIVMSFSTAPLLVRAPIIAGTLFFGAVTLALVIGALLVPGYCDLKKTDFA